MINVHTLETPGFWFLVSFILFLILIGRPAWKMIMINLDSQSKNISEQLNAAKIAREKAEIILRSAQKEKNSSAQQIVNILNHAKIESNRLEEDANKNLDQIIQREEKRAKDNIKRLESDANKRIQIKASQISIQIAKEILQNLTSDKVSRNKLDYKVLETIKDLKK